MLHLESLLEKYKTDVEEGDSTDKEAHAARKDKVKRVKRIINTEGMQKPYRIIKSVMKPAPSGSLSKLFVPVSSKLPKIAARFCDPDGSLSKDQLIAMAKFDRKYVNYEAILESDAMEKELHAYTCTIISGLAKPMKIPLVMANSLILSDLRDRLNRQMPSKAASVLKSRLSSALRISRNV